MKIDPNDTVELLVPAEALALIERAFGKPRKLAVERMAGKGIVRETTKALRTLIAKHKPGEPKRKFAVDDIVGVRKKKGQV
jgi:hypothetical protein